MRARITLIFLFGLLLVPTFAVTQTRPASGNSKEDDFYSAGTRAINEGRWQDAETSFDRVIEQNGSRREAALYWKAYAENKAGQSSKALATCLELKRSYPKSRWLDECSALEIEIRGRSGQPVAPHDAQDDNLKLLALNSLMQQDEARAMPILRQMLNGSGSEKLKERALFVLAQSRSQEAQNLITEIAKGQSNPDLQVKAIQMFAALRGPQSADFLADVYEHTTDAGVKKAVIQSYLVSGNRTRLMELVQHETHPELARSAVHMLGAMGAASELLNVYRSTTDTGLKASIVDGLVASGSKGADALASISQTEKDSDLRRKAIRNLGIAGGASVTPSLVETYRKNSDSETKQAVIDALFLAGDAHDLVELAKSERDPAVKQAIVQRLSLMQNKEASDYMLELLK